MELEVVRCRNFRNLENCTVSLSPGFTVICGDNGQGKTNFLESIYFLSTTRSFRISRDQELIQHGKKSARVEGQIREGEVTLSLMTVLSDQGKTCFAARQPVAKTSEFAGKLNAVLFCPDDLELFTGSPRIRRKMMDVEISKVDRRYSQELNRYFLLMKERNLLLRKEHCDDSLLDSIEQQMAEASVGIIRKRNEFVTIINENLDLRYGLLAQEDHSLQCRYQTVLDPLCEFDAQQIALSLQEHRQRDRILKLTSAGIHRDDLLFYLDHYPLANIASQGQKRMAALSLKMTFIDYAIVQTHKKPVLLLDDVFSELDFQKRKRLFETVPRQVQTIITTTSGDDWKKTAYPVKMLVVENGKIREELSHG